MGKIEVEMPDNVLRFLEAFCAFTGSKVEDIVANEMKTLAETVVFTHWSDGMGLTTVEDLRKRYGLESDC